MSLINSYCLNLSKVFCDPLQSLAELNLGMQFPRYLCKVYISIFSILSWYLQGFHCIVFMLSTISPCTTGLKKLYHPSNCTSTAQALKLLTFPKLKDHLSTSLSFFSLPLGDRTQ